MNPEEPWQVRDVRRVVEAAAQGSPRQRRALRIMVLVPLALVVLLIAMVASAR